MSDRLTEDVTKFQGRFAALKAEVGKVLVGQDDMLHRLLLGLLAGGHILLEGVPGLAKTLVVHTLASALDGTFILADEINRAPAKVQAALLEAMQERQVTLGEHPFKLTEPFLVLATQ